MNELEQNWTAQYVVPEDILTTEDEALLMEVRDRVRENYFLVGAITNKYIDLATKSQTHITNKDIYHQVGRIVGKPDRTVRYYAEVERCFSREVQEEYDILPFSFFDYARSKDNWREILDYAMENPSYSLKAIQGKFEEEFDPDSVPDEDGPSNLSRLQVINSLANLISNFSGELQLLADISGDRDIRQDIESMNLQLRKTLAKLVDSSFARG